jgi:hypothetical protein|tara:strand:+ start:12775 stop:13248 length:474 start_codon:yes stop_codon:yes gene_type:complete
MYTKNKLKAIIKEELIKLLNEDEKYEKMMARLAARGMTGKADKPKGAESTKASQELLARIRDLGAQGARSARPADRENLVDKILAKIEADNFKRKSLETIPFEKGSGTAAMAPAQQDLNRIKTALSIILKNPTAIKDLLSPEEKKALKTILAERDKK